MGYNYVPKAGKGRLLRHSLQGTFGGVHDFRTEQDKKDKAAALQKQRQAAMKARAQTIKNRNNAILAQAARIKAQQANSKNRMVKK